MKLDIKRTVNCEGWGERVERIKYGGSEAKYRKKYRTDEAVKLLLAL
jgi:hypothetical protein